MGDDPRFSPSNHLLPALPAVKIWPVGNLLAGWSYSWSGLHTFLAVRGRFSQAIAWRSYVDLPNYVTLTWNLIRPDRLQQVWLLEFFVEQCSSDFFGKFVHCVSEHMPGHQKNVEDSFSSNDEVQLSGDGWRWIPHLHGERFCILFCVSYITFLF